jgi:capsular polysaccharide biosynthesis protein
MRLINRRFVKSGLNIERLPDGIIVVYGAGSFGVFDRNGIFVKQSIQSRGKGQIIPPASALSEIHLQFDCDAVFVGSVDKFSIFGHYLLEHWTRAWAFLDKKYQEMKFVLVNDMRIETIPDFVLELARLLGIPAENFIILDKSARFRNVYVPEDSFKLVRFSSKEFGRIYAKIADNVKKNYAFDKIYVSRAALKHHRVYGEEKVQRIFEKNGYHIIYPEQLPLEEQIALMKNCKSLAGCSGSALHLAIFMPEGGNVILMRRNKQLKGGLLIAGTQYLITETKKLDLVHIEASIEKYKTKHYVDDHAQIIGVNEHMKRFFDDSGFNYSPSDVEFDRESWNEYIRQAEKLKAERREKYAGKSDLLVWLLERIVKFISCFIPNRHARVAFRTKLRKALGILWFTHI